LTHLSATATPPSVPSLYCQGNGHRQLQLTLSREHEDMQTHLRGRDPRRPNANCAAYVAAPDELLRSFPTPTFLGGFSYPTGIRWRKVVTVAFAYWYAGKNAVVSTQPRRPVTSNCCRPLWKPPALQMTFGYGARYIHHIIVAKLVKKLVSPRPYESNHPPAPDQLTRGIKTSPHSRLAHSQHGAVLIIALIILSALISNASRLQYPQ